MIWFRSNKNALNPLIRFRADKSPCYHLNSDKMSALCPVLHTGSLYNGETPSGHFLPAAQGWLPNGTHQGLHQPPFLCMRTPLVLFPVKAFSYGLSGVYHRSRRMSRANEKNYGKRAGFQLPFRFAL